MCVHNYRLRRGGGGTRAYDILRSNTTARTCFNHSQAFFFSGWVHAGNRLGANGASPYLGVYGRPKRRTLGSDFSTEIQKASSFLVTTPIIYRLTYTHTQILSPSVVTNFRVFQKAPPAPALRAHFCEFMGRITTEIYATSNPGAAVPQQQQQPRAPRVCRNPHSSSHSPLDTSSLEHTTLHYTTST